MTAHYQVNNRSEIVTCGNYYTWGADSVVTSTIEKGNNIVHNNIYLLALCFYRQYVQDKK